MLFSLLENRRTCVKASHGIGKTFLAAAAANWWYDTAPESIVYITAPTWGQCLGLTFKQIKRFRLNLGLDGEILDSGLIRDADRKRAGAHFIKALNAATGEGFQGEHSADILIIMEEAVGVPGHIWDASDGLMTSPGCRTLAIANPTDEATLFGIACGSPLYNILTISCLDHPNILSELAAEPPPFPMAVRLLWLREMLEKECERADNPEGDCFPFYTLETLDLALSGVAVLQDSPRCYYRPTASFQGRVLGQFPTQADEQVIPRGWLDLLPVLVPEKTPEIGCDVARFGSDRTTIATRCGPKVLSLTALRQLDNTQVTSSLREAAAQAAARYNERRGEEPEIDAKQVTTRIDVTGGLGTGPFDTLKREGYRVVPCNAGAKPADKEQFINRRSEMWWMMRDRVREKRLDLSSLPQEIRNDLKRELSTPKYKVDGAGRKVVEPKSDIKARLGASPDLADALNLAYTDMGKWWEDRELMAWLRDRGSEPDEAKQESTKAAGLKALMTGS